VNLNEFLIELIRDKLVFFIHRSLTELEQRTSRLTNEFQQTIENLSMKIEEQKHVSQVRS